MKTAVLSALMSAVVSVIATLVVVHLTVPAIANAQEGIISGQQFVLVGSDGSERGRLAVGTFPATGRLNPRFALREDGVDRVFLAYGGRSPEAAALGLRDRDGPVRIFAALATGLQVGSASDLTMITVRDRSAKPRLAMGVDFEGTPFIVLLDSAGNPVWNVGAPLRNVLKTSP